MHMIGWILLAVLSLVAGLTHFNLQLTRTDPKRCAEFVAAIRSPAHTKTCSYPESCSDRKRGHGDRERGRSWHFGNNGDTFFVKIIQALSLS